MAEETKPDFDKEVANEEAQLAAELARMKAAEQPPPPDEAAAAEPIPPEEKPVEEVKPPVEAKPEEKPPAETKPAEDRPRDGAAWKLLRQKEKELAEKTRELDERRAKDQQQTKPDAEPDFENQPADYLKRRIEQTEAKLAQVEAEKKRRDFLDNINRQEEEFSKTHADYRPAVDYLIQSDIKEWERTGASAVHTRQILGAARSADPQYGQLRNQLTTLANRPDLIAWAEKENRDPEEGAAYVIARDTWLSGRRDLIATGAEATGKSIPEIAYDLAQERGYRRQQEQKQQETEVAARARVEQSRRVSEAARSLSDSGTAESAPEQKVLRTRQQVLDLDDATLDKLIESGGYRTL